MNRLVHGVLSHQKINRLSVAIPVLLAVIVMGYVILPVRATTLVGDINADGAVNIFDLSVLLSHWGTADTNSDLNHDGTVNIFDLSTLLSHWGQTAPTPTPTPTPTPATPAILTGVSVPSDPSDPNLPDVKAFEADAGKPVSIIMWYQQWGATGGYQDFHADWLSNVRTHGSIPEITWEPWVGAAGVNQSAYKLQNIINGNFDSYITQWAQAAKAWGHPFFLRFAHEMNGNWYPWCEGVNGNSAGQYALAWQHVHNIFVQQGASNVTWVWAPNVEYTGSTSLTELYPGDAYVDWTGMDGYNWGTSQPGHSWQSFGSVFGQTYTDILAITAKPLMIAETGSSELGGSKSSWITDAYLTQLPRNFSKVRAVTWFNYNNSSYETDWRIESSASAQSAYNSAMQNPTFQSNLYANLAVSPVPSP